MKNTYKVAVVDEDGINFFGEPTEDSRHSEYLCQYIRENCSDIKAFERLNDRMIPEQLACFLVYVANKAIILNETKYTKSGEVKYGSMACVILPNEITNDMLTYLLSANLDRFSNVLIERVHLSNDKILEDNIIFDYDELPINDRLIALASDINKESRRFSK